MTWIAKNSLPFQVERIDFALYNCNWVDAPLKLKKLILIYKIRFSRPNFLKGGPFYVCNLELFCDVSEFVVV